jgi:hypothetical protein
MAELQPGGHRPHSVCSPLIPKCHDIQREIFHLAKPMFAHVDVLRIPVPLDHQGWILAAISCSIRSVKRYLNASKCRGLVRTRLRAIAPRLAGRLATAYADCPRRFMGVHVAQPNRPGIPPVHLSGCAVYDAQAHEGMKAFTQGNAAFDIAAAAYTVMRSINTPLMQLLG